MFTLGNKQYNTILSINERGTNQETPTNRDIIGHRLIGGSIKKVRNYVVEGDGILGSAPGKTGVYEKTDVV